MKTKSTKPPDLVHVNWRIPRDVRRRLKMAAAQESMPAERLAASVLCRYLARRGYPPDSPAA